MTTCRVLGSGDIELYFYGEIDLAGRHRIEEHLEACRDCREALDELRVIRRALSALPDVSSPPDGDWSGFMTRLDAAVDRQPPAAVVEFRQRAEPVSAAPVSMRNAYLGYAAVAAMLALVTLGIVRGLRDVPAPVTQVLAPIGAGQQEPASTRAARNPEVAGFTALTEQHFERSKLVVLGLATKDPEQASPADWTYERQLASSLLDDTRLYRLAAEGRGMDAVAGVMRDLELVLLQTSLSETADPETLAQIQRLIRKRDLLTKMNVLTTGT